jgi:hypothetical protein
VECGKPAFETASRGFSSSPARFFGFKRVRLEARELAASAGTGFTSGSLGRLGRKKVKRWGTWLRFWLTHARFPNNVLDCGCRSGMVVHGHAVSRFRAQFSESEEAAQREDSKSLKETLALGSGFKVGSDERRK